MGFSYKYITGMCPIISVCFFPMGFFSCDNADEKNALSELLKINK